MQKKRFFFFSVKGIRNPVISLMDLRDMETHLNEEIFSSFNVISTLEKSIKIPSCFLSKKFNITLRKYK